MHKDRNGHRTDTAGYGGDIGCLFGAGIEIQVAYKLVANTVDADVDKHCALLDHIAGDHLGLADCGNQDIGVTGKGSKILCARVANGNRSVFCKQKRAHRLADDIASAINNAILSRNVNVVLLKQSHYACRGAGLEAGRAGEKLA